MSFPETLAWSFTTTGPPRSALTLARLPSPVFPPSPLPSEEYILVTTSFSALNPGDLFTTHLIPSYVRKSPTVPGLDLVGTVSAVYAPHDCQARFKEGDKVVALVVFSHILSTGRGALAGQVAIPARYAVQVPAGREERDVAGLLVAGCTAMKMVDDAALENGQRVLIVGGSGGVGSMTLQMARHGVGLNGLVVSICSAQSDAMVRQLGAHEVIDYTRHNNVPGELAKRYGAEKFDAILDTVGADMSIYTHCAEYLKPEGVYSSVGVKLGGFSVLNALSAVWKMQINALWPKTPWLGGTGRTWMLTSMMDPGVELMQGVVDLLADGKLSVLVDSEWPFEQVLDAYDVVMSGRAKGKVIIKVSQEGSS